jgi:hypothetical protein
MGRPFRHVRPGVKWSDNPHTPPPPPPHPLPPADTPAPDGQKTIIYRTSQELSQQKSCLGVYYVFLLNFVQYFPGFKALPLWSQINTVICKKFTCDTCLLRRCRQDSFCMSSKVHREMLCLIIFFVVE